MTEVSHQDRGAEHSHFRPRTGMGGRTLGWEPLLQGFPQMTQDFGGDGSE